MVYKQVDGSYLSTQVEHGVYTHLIERKILQTLNVTLVLFFNRLGYAIFQKQIVCGASL